MSCCHNNYHCTQFVTFQILTHKTHTHTQIKGYIYTLPTRIGCVWCIMLTITISELLVQPHTKERVIIVRFMCNWSLVCLIDRLIGCLVGWMFGWLIDWLIDWLINWPFGRFIDWLIGIICLISCLRACFIVYLLVCLICWLFACFIDLSIDWLIDTFDWLIDL